MTERLSATEYRAMKDRDLPAGRSKYGARRTVVDGISFDSKKEAKRYADLRNLQRAGKITRLQRQVKIPLYGKDTCLTTDKGAPIMYRADFVYIDVSSGERVVEDCKGFRTPEYRLKKAILRAQNINILET